MQQAFFSSASAIQIDRQPSDGLLDQLIDAKPMADMLIEPRSEAAVILCECFARDRLQHEAQIIAPEAKAVMLKRIADVGFRRIEIASFSHPKHVPQFADADAVLDTVPPRAGVLFKATCPNPQAVMRALAAHARGRGPEEISYLVSASEGHTR